MSGTKEYKLPPEGDYAAVCVDFFSLGLQETQFGPKEQLRIQWELELKQDDGKPWIVGKTFTSSLSKKAKLRATLESWRGKSFTDEEARQDLNATKFVGVGCRIDIMHKENNGKTFAEYLIRKPVKKIAPSGGYKRSEFWEGKREEGMQRRASIDQRQVAEATNKVGKFANAQQEVAEDDIPF
jgi:hypothetical protein